MDYNQLILNWHNKASDKDYFSKYVFEYLAFIAFLKIKLYPNIGRDRDVIQKLKGDTNIKDGYLAYISSNQYTKKNWETIKAKLDKLRLGNASSNLIDVEEIKWWNCSHEQLHNKTEEEKIKLSGVIHSIDDWENMVEFWYSIRNNLFHGAKNPENARDQFAVKYGYKTLRELMKILLNENS